jgi:voltage-gated potassium channel
MLSASESGAEHGWRQRLWVIIFRADTPAGRAFDIALIVLIVASVITVMVESVASIRAGYGPLLRAIEWGFTALFTLEYLLRLICVRRPLRYATSFFGVIDLLAILPTYLSLFFPGAEALMVVRFLRVLRVFRILKLTEYLRESRTLTDALWAARRKIGVFLLSVLTLLTVVAALMYLIEGPEHGFTDIPTSMYWSVVTLTTVGFGDIAPKTPAGRAMASLVMIMGYGIIAVPTGIVTVELARAGRMPTLEVACPACFRAGHDADAQFCKHCGVSLAPAPSPVPDDAAEPPAPPTS